MNIFNKIIIHTRTQPSAAREKIKQGSERARAALKIWVFYCLRAAAFFPLFYILVERERNTRSGDESPIHTTIAIISRAARIYCKKATQKGLYGEKRNKERIINGAAVINFIVPPLCKYTVCMQEHSFAGCSFFLSVRCVCLHC
jgi:hypothetical protein